MTGRELLQKLQAVSPKVLDLQIYIKDHTLRGDMPEDIYRSIFKVYVEEDYRWPDSNEKRPLGIAIELEE